MPINTDIKIDADVLAGLGFFIAIMAFLVGGCTLINNNIQAERDKDVARIEFCQSFERIADRRDCLED